MSYTPSSENGDFAGQHGYGYISFEKFVDAVAKVKSGAVRDVRELDTAKGLPTLANTVATTAIMEAGRRSLDEGGRVVGVREGKGEEQWEFV
jgi:D-galacturonate reductase